jgi:phosphatidylglycerophosphate synthase
VFLFVADRPVPALVVLAIAGASDVLDGYLARRRRAREDAGPHRGDWLDPLCDKLFMGLVVAGLYRAYDPPLAVLLLLLAREGLQLVAFAALKVAPPFRSARFDFRAHTIGKAATVAQFLAAAGVVLKHPAALGVAAAAAALGVAAVVIYVRRGIEASRRPSP